MGEKPTPSDVERAGRQATEPKCDVRIARLLPFDEQYMRSLPSEFGSPFIADAKEGFQNIRSFTAVGEGGKRIGVVQFYDTKDDTNITNTVIDPAYRGQRLAQALKLQAMRELGETHFISFVNLTNTASIKAMEKIPGIKIVSDAAYEQEFGKRKYRYDQPITPVDEKS